MQGPGSLGVVSELTIISGSGTTGLFEYQGAPAKGNSPILWATAPGVTTDPSGNTLEASGGLAVARRSFNTVQEAIWLDPLTGALKLGSSFDGPNYKMGVVQVFNSTPFTLALLSPSDRPSPATHAMTVQLQMITGTSAFTDAGTFLFNNGGTGYTPISHSVIEIGMPSPANNLDAFSITDFNDTVARFHIDGNGVLQWGPGNAALDTMLKREAANTLQTTADFIFTDANFGDQIQIFGGNMSFNQVVWGTTGNLQATGGTPAGAVGPGVVLISPTMTGAPGFVAMAAFGESVDLTLAAGIVIAPSVNPPVRATPAILEVQGGTALKNLASAPASVTGYTQLYSDTFTQLHTDRAFQTDDHIEIANLGVTPGAGGSGGKLWSNTGHLNIVSAQVAKGGDTLNYDTEHLTMSLAADTASLSNTAATNIPGLPTKTVQAQKYLLRAIITFKQGVAAGTITINFAGPAVASGGMSGSAIDNSNVNQVNSTAGLGSIGQTQTNIGRSTKVVLEGVVTFSAAGTLSVQSRTSLAADTYLIQAGSYWELIPVVAT